MLKGHVVMISARVVMSSECLIMLKGYGVMLKSRVVLSTRSLIMLKGYVIILKLVYLVCESCKLVYTTCYYVKCICCFVKQGFTGVYIIFLISAQNIDYGYSLEPPYRGGSNEYPHSKF